VLLHDHFHDGRLVLKRPRSFSTNSAAATRSKIA